MYGSATVRIRHPFLSSKNKKGDSNDRKNKTYLGADETTPSHPQYFSWINNNNEGGTEAQTLINLEYFKWLHDTYGMNLEIYAWDCGNLDGSGSGYAHPEETEKLREQYPRGYGPSAQKAAEFGCHMGMWVGPDGYGDTPEEEAKRRELLVGLCRDHGFMEYKFDMVCGDLRPEKRGAFKETIDECRKYVPDLVVLNHRIDLAEAEICATTFLWEGGETYVDVANHNKITGSHHRVGAMSRGLVPGLKRLTEDHGVCISSCLDYFEDDLILQAFGRCLILAPEIYGNPWLMRDMEQERMAKIYNTHWRYRDILVNGMELPPSYGDHAVSRGDGATRLIVLKNLSWEKRGVSIAISEEIGLADSGEYVVKTLHPYESYVGTYRFGEKAEVTVEPFRAALILVQEKSLFDETDFVLTNCTYETITDGNRLPKKIYVWSGNGAPIGYLGNEALAAFALKNAPAVREDHTVKAPRYLGEAAACPMPDNAEQLYEVTCFTADADSLEIQSLRRSGETAFPAVKAARDAFFAQAVYDARGCETKALFDHDPNTFLDGESVYFQDLYGGPRLNGGCLRVDLGKVCRVSRVEIEFFEIDEPIKEVFKPNIGKTATVSPDLARWTDAPLRDCAVTEEHVSAPVIRFWVETLFYADGVKKTAVYDVDSDIRYFRLDQPMDRIYAFRAYDENGEEIGLTMPHANNLLSPYAKKDFRQAKIVTVHVSEDAEEGTYLACGIEGKHGVDGAYCGAFCDGVPVGFDDRAVSFPVNFWSHLVQDSENGYTYYMTVTDAIRGKDVAITVLLETEEDLPCKVWLCDGTDKTPAAIFENN